MTAFYRCEIKGSVEESVFICYAEAWYNHNYNKFKADADMEVENKAYNYFDGQLASTYGEIESISIIDITAEEYYGMKKIKSIVFL